jgi:hypothetical protein
MTTMTPISSTIVGYFKILIDPTKMSASIEAVLRTQEELDRIREELDLVQADIRALKLFFVFNILLLIFNLAIFLILAN